MLVQGHCRVLKYNVGVELILRSLIIILFWILHICSTYHVDIRCFVIVFVLTDLHLTVDICSN
jgi:hypothetical protein